MRTRQIAAGLLLCSTMFSGHAVTAGQSSTAYSAPTGTVTGRLLSKDGTPAQGIRVSAVEARDPGGPPVIPVIVSSATTNNSGEFKVDNIPAGRYYITSGLVDLPTYYPGVSDLSGAAVVQIPAGATVSGINFAMAVGIGFKVSGRVLGSPTAPITGLPTTMIVVMLPLDSPMIQDSSVQADGSFEFSRVRPGRYSLRMPFLPSQQQSAVITVVDKDVTGIELVAPALVNVTGQVTVADGTANSVPSFSLSFAGSTRGIVNVRPDGKFQTSLPAGEYRISPSAIPAGYYLKSITAGSTDLSQTPLKLAGPSAAEVVVILGFQPAPADSRK